MASSTDNSTNSRAARQVDQMLGNHPRYLCSFPKWLLLDCMRFCFWKNDERTAISGTEPRVRVYIRKPNYDLLKSWDFKHGNSLFTTVH